MALRWHSHIALLAIAACARAQTSPAELAQTVVQRWSAGSETDFAAIYPFREGRDALAANRGKFSLSPGLAKVVRTAADHAVLLLSGVPLLPNSGDATIVGREFSGVYEARSKDAHWKLTARIPLEDLGQILAHRMKVSIRPGSGLSVEDRMRIRVKGTDGFAVRLNHAAKLEDVSIGGQSRAHLFGGGLLWADLPGGETELTLRYSIEVEKGPKEETNSACFLESAGHVRNQYFWHPYFDFNSNGGDLANFDIEVRIPRDYLVSTSIPQTERVEGAERIVNGKTIQRAVALTLVYDRDWKLDDRRFGDVRLTLSITPEFQPDADTIGDEFRLVYTLLSDRFGRLAAGSFGVVEARSFKENAGWRFASNQIIVAAGMPKVVSMKSPFPSASLGHEIAHFWMHGAAGPAANFLREGWATWAESLILENKYGPETAREFWKNWANVYLLQSDGKASLLEDENNSGVAYSKGPWVFRMLEDAIGSQGFQNAIAEYSRRSLVSPSGWEVLAECAQRYAPPDFNARSFLLPWLAGKQAPRLTAQTDGRKVTIRQEPPDFILPVVVEASTAQGPERHRIWMKGAETTIEFSGEPSDVRIDPDGSLLLRR